MYTGEGAHKDVYVNKAAVIGQKQMAKFCTSLPQGFTERETIYQSCNNGWGRENQKKISGGTIQYKTYFFLCPLSVGE